jgi:hypothetical protein
LAVPGIAPAGLGSATGRLGLSAIRTIAPAANPALAQYSADWTAARLPNPSGSNTLAAEAIRAAADYKIDADTLADPKACKSALRRHFNNSRFQKERYGTSLRAVTPPSPNPPPPPPPSSSSSSSLARAPAKPDPSLRDAPQYLARLPVRDAGIVALWRFDTQSPWRLSKRQQRADAACPDPVCRSRQTNGHSEARASHFICHCHSTADERKVFLAAVARISGAYASSKSARVRDDASALSADLLLTALLTPRPHRHLHPNIFAALLPFALRFLRRSYHVMVRLLRGADGPVDRRQPNPNAPCE